jgi:ribosomal protein L16/L10AE
MIVRIGDINKERAREALKVASSKLPMVTKVNIVELKKVAPA